MLIHTSLRTLGIVLLSMLMSVSVTADEKSPALETNECAPKGELRGDPEAGAEVYAENCTECHGHDGKAAVIVLHMDEPPRDQTDVEYMKSLNDMFLYLAICKGGGAVGQSLVMPGWGDFLTDRQIRDLVAWIRTFSGT